MIVGIKLLLSMVTNYITNFIIDTVVKWTPT